MKKRVVAACLAAVLGIAPCSVGASQESEAQCISESEISDILLETCTQELLETQEVSEETLQEIETVKQEIQSESEATVEQNQKHSQQMKRKLQKKFKQNLRQNLRNRHKNLYWHEKIW